MHSYHAHLEPFRQLAREINQERATVASADLPQSQENPVLSLDASTETTSITQLQELQENLEITATELPEPSKCLFNDNNPEIIQTPQLEQNEEPSQKAVVRQRREGLKNAVSHKAFPMSAFLIGLVALVWVSWKVTEVVLQGIYAAFVVIYRALNKKSSPEPSKDPTVAWAEWIENPVNQNLRMSKLQN